MKKRKMKGEMKRKIRKIKYEKDERVKSKEVKQMKKRL